MGPIILPVLPMPGTQVEAGKGQPMEGHSGDNGDQPGRVPIDRSSRPRQWNGGNGRPDDTLTRRRVHTPLRRQASFLRSAQTA